MPRVPRLRKSKSEPAATGGNPLLLVIVLLVAMFLSSGKLPLPAPLTPSPIAAEGLRVMVIYDEDQESTMPREQQAILNSPTLRDWLDARCVKDATGTPEYRFWPLAVAAAVGEDQPIWQQFVKLERKSDRWLIVADGRKYFSGALPPNEAETLKILEGFAK